MSNEIEKEKVQETSALPKSHGSSITDLKSKVGAGKDGRGGSPSSPKSE